MSVLDGDLLALGSCIAGCGLLMTGLLALLFRNPKAPGWTRPEVVALLVCVPVTGTIGVGLGYTAYGLSQVVTGDGAPHQLLVLASVLIALPLAWRALSIRRQLQAYAAATAGDAPSASPPGGPTPGIGGEAAAAARAARRIRPQGRLGLWHDTSAQPAAPRKPRRRGPMTAAELRLLQRRATC